MPLEISAVQSEWLAELRTDLKDFVADDSIPRLTFQSFGLIPLQPNILCSDAGGFKHALPQSRMVRHNFDRAHPGVFFGKLTAQLLKIETRVIDRLIFGKHIAIAI